MRRVKVARSRAGLDVESAPEIDLFISGVDRTASTGALRRGCDGREPPRDADHTACLGPAPALQPPFAPARQCPEQRWRACIDTSDSTDFSWGRCGGEFIEREDAALNAEWSRVYPGLPSASKAALLDGQRAWIAYLEKARAF